MANTGKGKDPELSLRQAAKYLDIGDFRMRNLLIHDDRVQGRKVKKAHYEMWVVKKSVLDAYIASKGRNQDGKKAYIVRLSPEQFDAIKPQLDAMEVSIESRYEEQKRLKAKKAKK